MDLNEGNFYHIYNRGNNGQLIFFSEENYIFFLKKMRSYTCPEAKLLAYCLMPNHFHWLVYIPNRDRKTDGSHSLNKNIGTLLRSYAQAINKRQDRTGSLFQQKTKAAHINSQLYVTTCFHYIHQNPLKANLVEKIGDWSFSSFPDYADTRNGTLVDKQLALKYLGINKENFIKDSLQAIDPQKIEHIY